MRPLSLLDIVDVSTLQELQDSFSNVTKLAMVMVDYQGVPITRYSNYTDHCTRLREIDECREFCFASDAYGGMKATRSSEPYIYTCYAGLTDISIPIVFQGQVLGSILIGQIRVKDRKFPENTMRGKENIQHILDGDIQKDLFNRVNIIDEEELYDSVRLITILANYIIKIGVSNLVKDELNDKNERLKNEMRVRLSMEKMLRESEVKVLKSQVNPHFLFNILNNINNLAMIERAERTSEMVYSFTDMLRYTMKNESTDTVTLRDEINYTKQYLKIQHMRFGDNLQYEFKIEDDLLDIECPFMILQPIVANSIDHGLFKKENNGFIKIRVFEEKGDVVTQVYDDGVGIDKDTINSILNAGTLNVYSETGMGIGLINIDKRLLYQYGNTHRLQIESKIDEYTKVTIRIPR